MFLGTTMAVFRICLEVLATTQPFCGNPPKRFDKITDNHDMVSLISQMTRPSHNPARKSKLAEPASAIPESGYNSRNNPFYIDNHKNGNQDQNEHPLFPGDTKKKLLRGLFKKKHGYQGWGWSIHNKYTWKEKGQKGALLRRELS